MLWPWVLGYLVAGAVTTSVTFFVFPPMEGFRPHLALKLLAFLVFMVLWPVLLALAVWYLSVGYLNRNKQETVERRKTVEIPPSAMGSLQATKPR